MQEFSVSGHVQEGVQCEWRPCCTGFQLSHVRYTVRFRSTPYLFHFIVRYFSLLSVGQFSVLFPNKHLYLEVVRRNTVIQCRVRAQQTDSLSLLAMFSHLFL